MKKTDVKDIYSLAPMQEGMLFSSLLDQTSTAYFEQMDVSLSGSIQPLLLEQTVNLLADKYDVLRTIFTYKKTKKPRQVVLKKISLSLPFHDISPLNDLDKESYLERFKREDRSAGFDLSKGPLMRVVLFKTGVETFRLIWSYHHILMDGWCFGILFGDFMEIYDLLNRGQKVTPGVTAPYSRYIQWLEQQDRQKGLDFWQAAVADYHTPAVIPRNSSAAGTAGYEAGRHTVVLERELSDGLNRLAMTLQVTLSSLLQTLWGVLLQKYNNADDVVFGIIVSGRPPHIAGIGQMVGLFINAVPVRVDNRDNLTFSQLAAAVQGFSLEARSFEYVPLTDIQSLSPLKNQLTDHVLAFENVPVSSGGAQGDGGPFRVTGVDMYEQTGYDFNFLVAPTGHGLELKWLFNAHWYDESFIAAMAGHLGVLMSAVVADGECEMRYMSLLTAEEKEHVLIDLNGPLLRVAEGKTVLDFFLRQASERPDCLAAVGSADGTETHLTYGLLALEVRQLAGLLRTTGVSTGTIVAIRTEPSLEMVIAILAVLSAGAAYLPVDTGYPEGRCSFMLKDSNAFLLLTDSVFAGSFFCPAIYLNHLRHPFFEGAEEEPAGIDSADDGGAPGATDAAYVIYTSGSTGKPKGVLVEHGALLNLCCVHNDRYGVTEWDRASKYAGTGFDASVWELFPYLCAGAALYVVPQRWKLDMAGLALFFESMGITIAFLPTQVAEHFMGLENGSLRLLLTGGDKLRRFVKRTYRLINNYGPTENTVVTTAFEVNRLYPNIPIGAPLANTAVYVLDRYGLLQPVGVPGELVVAGAGLARGYLNRPELTAEKFKTKFFGGPGTFLQKGSWPPEASQKVYHTGDNVRWLADGNLEFLGRVDLQVKIRGYRIELGEIEAHIMRYRGVAAAVVTDCTDSDGAKFLCAYVVPDPATPPDMENLNVYLAESLPDYMIPAFRQLIAAVPLNANGKVDRSRLPQPWATRSLRAGAVYLNVPEM